MISKSLTEEVKSVFPTKEIRQNYGEHEAAITLPSVDTEQMKEIYDLSQRLPLLYVRIEGVPEGLDVNVIFGESMPCSAD